METNPEVVFKNPEHPTAQIYKKECRVCKNIRSFYAGSERDRQSVCGNCWVW